MTEERRHYVRGLEKVAWIQDFAAGLTAAQMAEKWEPKPSEYEG
jgi:hypothetical protein